MTSTSFVVVGIADIPAEASSKGTMATYREIIRQIPEGKALVLAFPDEGAMQRGRSKLIEAAKQVYGATSGSRARFHTSGTCDGGRYLLTIWRNPIAETVQLSFTPQTLCGVAVSEPAQ